MRSRVRRSSSSMIEEEVEGPNVHRRVGKVPDEGHRGPGGRSIFPEEVIEVV